MQEMPTDFQCFGTTALYKSEPNNPIAVPVCNVTIDVRKTINLDFYPVSMSMTDIFVTFNLILL